MGMNNNNNGLPDITGLPGYVAPIRLNAWRRRALLGVSVHVTGGTWIVQGAGEDGVLSLRRWTPDGLADRAFPFSGLVATGARIAYAGSWIAAAEWLAIH